MLFNSLEFAIFLPVVFFIYWFLLNKNLKVQNFFLLAVSYFFYGWWDYRFLGLLFMSSTVDYVLGIQLSKTDDTRKRKLLLIISIALNLGLLGYFKYYNFFVDSFIDAFSFFGTKLSARSLNIILPVGLSFYTFQSLSYGITCYRRQLTPTRDFISFLAYVSFFPQLVAGPIERATHLLPQFYKKRTFEYTWAVSGIRLILWGMLKKVVIADTCATNANYIFDNYETLNSSVLVLGLIHFAFQIYCDFSGYSDIAIGTARLFGFDLMRNFNYPYFSRDIAEFWRRWHISLTTWFRDYVYIPLGGSRVSKSVQIRNTFIVFILSGFWHGANWTFIVWGALNAIYFLPLLVFDKTKQHVAPIDPDKILPSPKEFFQILLTFTLTLIAWTFFRAENSAQAFDYLAHIVSGNFLDFDILELRGRGISESLVTGSIGIGALLVFEWVGRTKECPIEFARAPRWVMWPLYWVLCFLLFTMAGKEQTFIYFQF